MHYLGIYLDNLDSSIQLVCNSSQLQSQNQVKLDNCLIHKKDHFDTHHENHNLLHFLCREFQMHKNLHLQLLVDNNNQIQNLVKLDNSLIHREDQSHTHHENRNPPHLLHKQFQIHKNAHLQKSDDNSNQLQSQNQGNLHNCLIHMIVQLDTHNDNYNLLNFQYKCYNSRIQIPH